MVPVKEFYRGKTLLVSGATGFIGKVCHCLHCPVVSHTYLHLVLLLGYRR